MQTNEFIKHSQRLYHTNRFLWSFVPCIIWILSQCMDIKFVLFIQWFSLLTWGIVLFFKLSLDFHGSNEKKSLKFVWKCAVQRTSWNVSFFVSSCKFTVEIFSIYLLWYVGQKKWRILYKIHLKHTIADWGNLFTLRKLTFVWKISGAFWFSVWKHS